MDHPRGLHDDVCNSIYGSIIRTYENANIIRDEWQFGINEEPLTLEESLKQESLEWLMDKKPKHRDEDDFHRTVIEED